LAYKFTFSQEQAYPGEESRADLPDFAPNFSASTFKTYADVGQAYQIRAKEKAKERNGRKHTVGKGEPKRGVTSSV
jgi:hypothetical protein